MAAAAPSAEAAPSSPPSRSIVPPVAATAVGVLGIGAAVPFGVQATNEASDLRASACAPQCPASSLDGVHRDLLDEASWSGPSAVIDRSGRGNHGTTVNTMSTSTQAKFGRSASFDGTGWIDVNDSASLHATDKLTYAAWIYPTSLSDGLASPGVLAKRDGANQQVAFKMFLWTSNQLWVDLGTTRDTTPTVFANNRWYHVASCSTARPCRRSASAPT